MSNPKKPNYIAYDITEGKEKKSIWNAAGAAWNHKDSKGFNIALYAVPVSGKITLRAPKLDDGK